MGQLGNALTGLGCLLVLLGPDPAQAQGLYTLGDAAHFVTGCAGPSPCDCAVHVAGALGGTFELTRTGTSGAFEEFAITAIDWVLGSLDPLPVLTPISGAGVYRVDPVAGLQGIELHLLIGGVTQIFQSVGDVPLGVSFPDGLVIEAFHELMPGGCDFDGVVLTAGRTELAFQRGDCNGDGTRDIADAIHLLGVLFGPLEPQLPCADACDGNDDGSLNIADAVTLLSVLFGGGALPPPVTCGVDPTNDGLGCTHYPGC